MSFLDEIKVSSAPINSPYFLTIYGDGGIGKSGLCLSARDPFYVSIDPYGADWIPAPKFIGNDGKVYFPKTSEELLDMTKLLLKKSFVDSLEKPVGTVIIDGLGFAQRLFYKDIVEKNPFTTTKEPKKVESIVDLGYDGQGMVMQYWERLLNMVHPFKKRGINVIFITHSIKVNDTSPSGDTYKRIDMELQAYGNHNVPGLLKKECDAIYYMSGEVNTITKNRKTSADGRNTSQLMVSTRQTSLFYAKTRPGINEERIPDSYYFDASSRSSVATQIFNDLEGK